MMTSSEGSPFLDLPRASPTLNPPLIRERTCELDIGAFLHCKDSKICFVRLAYGIAKAEE